jgi:hypothetical protein
MRHVSRFARPVIVILGSLTFLTVLYVTAAQSSVFPDSVRRYVWTIAAHGSGASKPEAIANLLRPQQRATDFFEANGFSSHLIVIGPPIAQMGGTLPSEIQSDVKWSASQDIGVPADTYAKFARLSNRLELYQQSRNDLTWSFPEPPFAAFARIVGFLTLLFLCVSVVSLETRAADVNRAPRGMHPLMIAIQTLTFGLLILASLVEAHVLALLGPRVFACMLVLGVISLAAWLLKTRAWWMDQAFLRYALFYYAAALAAVALYGVHALMVPVT